LTTVLILAMNGGRSDQAIVDASNASVPEDFKPILAGDVVHCFLPDRFAPIRGAGQSIGARTFT